MLKLFGIKSLEPFLQFVDWVDAVWEETELNDETQKLSPYLSEANALTPSRKGDLQRYDFVLVRWKLTSKNCDCDEFAINEW